MGRDAWLDSEYMLCISTDAFGRIAHNFYVAVDSNPEVFFFALTQNGEVCSVAASGA